MQPINLLDLLYRIVSPAIVIFCFLISYDYFFRRALKSNKETLKLVIDELYDGIWQKQADEFKTLFDEQRSMTNKMADNLHILEVVVARIDERKYIK